MDESNNKVSLTIHTQAWTSRCHLMFHGISSIIGDRKISLHKESLLLTIQYYYEKAENLPANYMVRDADQIILSIKRTIYTELDPPSENFI